MLLYLFLSSFLFKCSLLEKIFVSVTNKQYLVSINFHVHIRAILDKWDYVSKTLFTIFKGSLRRRIPQWMRALSLYCPIYHIGVTPIYVLKLHLHFIDFWQHQKNNINRNFTLN